MLLDADIHFTIFCNLRNWILNAVQVYLLITNNYFSIETAEADILNPVLAIII